MCVGVCVCKWEHICCRELRCVLERKEAPDAQANGAETTD